MPLFLVVLALLENDGTVLTVYVLSDFGLVGLEFDFDVFFDLIVHGDGAVLVVQMLLLLFFALVGVAEKVLKSEAVRAAWSVLLVALDLIDLDEIGLELPCWDLRWLVEERLRSHVVHVIRFFVFDLIVEICEFLILVFIFHSILEASVHLVIVD